jgi:hypothetical protein
VNHVLQRGNAMEIKFRNFNKQECYACKVKDIKQLFSKEDDVFVSFGFLGRSYFRDSHFIKHPTVQGLVICSIQYNRRLNLVKVGRPILNFYVIKDEKYNDIYSELFVKSILPKINEWYHNTLSLPDTEIPGVEILLVEWTGDDFKLHNCRFA